MYCAEGNDKRCKDFSCPFAGSEYCVAANCSNCAFGSCRGCRHLDDCIQDLKDTKNKLANKEE